MISFDGSSCLVSGYCTTLHVWLGAMLPPLASGTKVWTPDADQVSYFPNAVDYHIHTYYLATREKCSSSLKATYSTTLVRREATASL